MKIKLKIGGNKVASVSNAPAPSRKDPPRVEKPRPKIKLAVPQEKVQTIKLKPGKLARQPRFPPGLGYDSESSEREDDPAIEEQFILRMLPGEDCEIVRQAIEDKTIDVDGPIQIKFVDPRRACVTVGRNKYAATLYDMPTVTESYKTLDKKNVHKVCDICQILVVERKIQDESEISAKALTDNLDYPHGLVPPLRNVRQQRFRKREHTNRSIEATEREIERLERADEAAESTAIEMIDESEITYNEEREQGFGLLDGYEQYDEDEDAVGEEDDGFDELENALFDDDGEEDADRAEDAQKVAAESSEEDDEDMDDDDEDGAMDEEAAAAAQEKQKLKEEIEDLEETIGEKEKELLTVQNPIIRGRIEGFIRNLKEEAAMKRKMLGGSDEDDD